MESIRKKSCSGSEMTGTFLGLVNKKSKTNSSEIDGPKAKSKSRPRYVLLTRRSIETEPAEIKTIPNEPTSVAINKEVTSMRKTNEVTSMTTTKEVTTSRMTTKDVTSTKTMKTVGDVASKKDDGCCKNRTICITAIIFVVLLVAFCAIAIVVWFGAMSAVPTTTVLEPTTTVPEPTSTLTTLEPTTTTYKYADVPVVNLTEYCLRNLTSKCHFSEQKYLTNCSQLMTCHSIGYIVGYRNLTKRLGTEATFTPFDAELILVPDHAPCMLDNAVGRCIEGECELEDLNLDIPLRDYSNLVPQNGSFDKAGSPSSKMPYDQEHCIAFLPRVVDLFRPLSGECKKMPSSCMLFKLFLRRCWAPLPSAGGEPCSDQVMAFDYDQQCPTFYCARDDFIRSSLSHLDCAKMKDSSGKRIEILDLAYSTCNGTIERNGGGYPDDFYACCSRNHTETGFCMAGHCLIQKQDE